jgi:hypothetical protein
MPLEMLFNLRPITEGTALARTRLQMSYQKIKIAKDIVGLKNLTSDNLTQTAWLFHLEVEFNKKIAFSDTIIHLVSKDADLKQAQSLLTEG